MITCKSKRVFPNYTTVLHVCAAAHSRRTWSGGSARHHREPLEVYSLFQIVNQKLEGTNTPLADKEVAM